MQAQDERLLSQGTGAELNRLDYDLIVLKFAMEVSSARQGSGLSAVEKRVPAIRKGQSEQVKAMGPSADKSDG